MIELMMIAAYAAASVPRFVVLSLGLEDARGSNTVSYLLPPEVRTDSNLLAALLLRGHREAARILRNHDDAWDAVDRTITAVIAIDTVPTDVEAYFVRAVWATAVTMLRERGAIERLRCNLSAAPEPIVDSPEAQVLENEETMHREERVRQALASLPERIRPVATLVYCEGLTRSEAASALGLPLTTINNRIHEARTLLRDNLSALAPVARPAARHHDGAGAKAARRHRAKGRKAQRVSSTSSAP